MILAESDSSITRHLLQQLLLDAQTVRGLLMDAPVLNSTTDGVPAAYARRVALGIGRAEAALKVVATPTDGLADAFEALLPGASREERVAILELRGVPGKQQSPLLDLLASRECGDVDSASPPRPGARKGTITLRGGSNVSSGMAVSTLNTANSGMVTSMEGVSSSMDAMRRRMASSADAVAQRVQRMRGGKGDRPARLAGSEMPQTSANKGSIPEGVSEIGDAKKRAFAFFISK